MFNLFSILMDIQFNEGYVIYKKNEKNNLVIVVPHSGPALEVTSSRDEYSDTVGSLLWNLLKGKLVISNMSRKRFMGIDFNRDIPQKKNAIDIFDDFRFNNNTERLHEFRLKYAWAAKDEIDYDKRLEIYNNFWREVNGGKIIIFLHRAFTRLKVLPSVMDLTTFDSKGIKKELLQKIVEDVNAKYYDFFKKIEIEYKNVMYLEQERVVNNLLRIFGSFDLKKINIEFRTNIKKDLALIKQLVKKKTLEKLEHDFSPQNFLEASREAIEKAGKPMITVEKVFQGKLALGPKKQLSSGKRFIQFEPTSFIMSWYPHKTAEIISEIIKGIIRHTQK